MIMLLHQAILPILIGLPAVLVAYAFVLAAERRFLAGLRLGFPPGWGILWPLADVLRALTKPERRPPGWAGVALAASGPLAVAVAGSLLALALVPAGGSIVSEHHPLAGWGQRPLAAVVLLDALGCGCMLLYGAARGNAAVRQASARAAFRGLAYGLPAWLSLSGAALLAGSLDLDEMVWTQATNLPFVAYQPLGAVVCTVSLLCGHRRLPFTLPGPASRLIQDFHLQHAGVTLALAHLAEYLHLLGLAALLVTVYLGGPLGILLPGAAGLLTKALLVWALLLWLRGRPLARLQERIGPRLWTWLMVAGGLNWIGTALALYGSR